MTVFNADIDMTIPFGEDHTPSKIYRTYYGTELDKYTLVFKQLKLHVTIELFEKILKDMKMMERNHMTLLNEEARRETELWEKFNELYPDEEEWVIDYKTMVAQRIEQLNNPKPKKTRHVYKGWSYLL